MSSCRNRPPNPLSPFPGGEGGTPGGFTLLEVIVALAVAGIVVLLAERLFAAAGTAAAEVATARTRLDRDANARRWLAGAFLSLSVGQQAGDGFSGVDSAVTFSTLRETSEGWFEPSRLHIRVEHGRLVGGEEGGPAIGLADSVAAAAFDYLLEPGADAAWVRAWESPVSAPLAVRLRLTRQPAVLGAPSQTDTLLLPIRGRG